MQMQLLTTKHKQCFGVLPSLLSPETTFCPKLQGWMELEAWGSSYTTLLSHIFELCIPFIPQRWGAKNCKRMMLFPFWKEFSTWGILLWGIVPELSPAKFCSEWKISNQNCWEYGVNLTIKSIFLLQQLFLDLKKIFESQGRILSSCTIVYALCPCTAEFRQLLVYPPWIVLTQVPQITL